MILEVLLQASGFRFKHRYLTSNVHTTLSCRFRVHVIRKINRSFLWGKENSGDIKQRFFYTNRQPTPLKGLKQTWKIFCGQKSSRNRGRFSQRKI
ncbi:hypothetical protein L2E82_30632 [Cichorium intybus]|uniref:Uncharacterized protein n=1 Tax=Cichorium intybus TaxID=13427 RepID=A0ACB9D1E1_CICIN|nr:hypothetical protein L2E82_30632 [Cichorium intybus]